MVRVARVGLPQMCGRQGCAVIPVAFSPSLQYHELFVSLVYHWENGMLKSGVAGRKLATALMMVGFFTLGNRVAADDHNAYIPSDTPFYMGTGEGIPAKLMLAFMPTASLPVPDDIEPDRREFLETFNDVISNLDESLARWGVGDSLHFSAYAVGAHPVLRVRLADVDKFNSALGATEEKHGIKSRSMERKDLNIRLYDRASFAALIEADKDAEPKGTDDEDTDDEEVAEENSASSSGASADATEDQDVNDDAIADFGIIVATGEHDLIVAVLSDITDDDRLDRVLGLSKPPTTMTDSGKLDKLRKRWGYAEQYAAFIDFRVLADILTSDQSQASKDITELFGDDIDRMSRLALMRSEPCRAEINALAANWPMAVLGVHELDASDDEIRYVTHMATEVGHTALKDTLKLLRGVLPASQSAAKPLFSLGLGLSVDNLTQFISQMTGILTGVQHDCPLLRDLNRLSSTDLSAASMGVVMFGGLARGVEGIAVNLFDMEFSTEDSADPIKAADMAVVVNAKDPALLVQTLQMMPQLGMLTELPLDGTEISLNSMLPIPVPDGVELKAAVKDKNIVIFGGEKAAEYIGRLDNSSRGGFLYTHIDTASLIERATSVIQMIGQESDELDSAVEYMKRYPKGTIDYSVDFTDNGIELLSTAVVKRPASEE